MYTIDLIKALSHANKAEQKSYIKEISFDDETREKVSFLQNVRKPATVDYPAFKPDEDFDLVVYDSREITPLSRRPFPGVPFFGVQNARPSVTETTDNQIMENSSITPSK